MRKLLLFVIVFVLPQVWFLWGQNPPANLDEARRELEKIRLEISSLQQKLSSAEKELRSQLVVAENLDKQITLVNRAITLLQTQIQASNRKIARLEHSIDSVKTHIDALQELFKKQIVFAYKYYRGKEIDWILGSQSVNQALVRYRYFQKLALSERKNYEKLKQQKEKLIALQKELISQVNSRKKLLADKKSEQGALKEKKQQKEKAIRQIQKDQKLLSAALKEKQRNYEKLKSIIATLERERKERKLAPETQALWENIAGNFSRQKGNLNWPVSGKILHPFGKYKNPQLKTVLYNSGIDIQAPGGTPVRCVFSGVVSLITYMSGFGNTIIVDHNNGFYSVYTHLDEIRVSKFQFVNAGQVLGSVGDSGSLEGPLLHFEIYGNNEPLNPLVWLKGR